MLGHQEYLSLMGKEVTATGNCGLGDGLEVTGILSEHDTFKNMPLVTVTIKENPKKKEVYSVYRSTIKKA